MGYCNHTPYKRYRLERPDWEEGYTEFINLTNPSPWEYDFQINGENSKSDYESSFLSLLVFSKLFTRTQNDEKKLKIELYTDYYSINVEKEGKSIQFLFDVMNNPKKGHQPHTRAIKSEYIKETEELNFNKIYHTIGNFAPIPRTVIAGKKGPKLQFIHNNLNESWTLFLKYLRDNWKIYPTEIHDFFSFEKYMQYSCQHMYYKKLFDSLYKKQSETPNNWNRLFLDLDNVEIKENDVLISFDELYINGNKDEIMDVDSKICFLIELRGRYILHKLKIQS